MTVEQGPSDRPRVEIEYCIKCRWLLRAGWLGQELLSTFSDELGEVALMPGRTGGVFQVRLVGAGEAQLLWDRKAEGGFPDAAELKRRLRDRVAPERDLGHVEGAGTAESG